MSDTSNNEYDSVVEYSLSEVGFILVFVLLLFSAWELNENFEQLSKKTADIIKLEEELIKARQRIKVLKSDRGWDDDMVLVPKSQISTNEEKIKRLENQLERLQNSIEKQNLPPQDSLKKGNEHLAGADSICTHAPPSADSPRLKGKSLPIGTIVIGEDYLTVVDKNLSLANMKVVDITGKDYDTTLVMQALERWPTNVALSPEQFKDLGREFVDIGNIPSDHRVACRFAMDYYLESYSKKAHHNFEKVFQHVFYKNNELTQDQISLYLSTGSKEQSATFKNDNDGFDSPFIGDDMNYKPPQIQSKQGPDYPTKALKRSIKGYVKLRYVVSPSGNATKIEIIEESPLGFGFGKESVKTLKKFRYKPAEVNGIPTESREVQIQFTFNHEGNRYE